MATVIDGKAIAAKIRGEIAIDVNRLETAGVKPGLAVVLVGEDPASKVYVSMKEKACQDVGIFSDEHKLPVETSEAELLGLIQQLNADSRIDGILVQLPLPKHIDTEKVLEAISPHKDVDGFHPYNVGRLVVGKPVAFMCLQQHATVTLCHSRTKNLAQKVGMADVLIAAVGQPEMNKGAWIKEGAVVIDVGVNRVGEKKLVGDVEYAAASERASAITPVPGGVGPMTITMLLYNTVESAKNRGTRNR